MDHNQSVIEANIKLHTVLSDHYNTCEPHFRPENISKVEEKIRVLAEKHGKNELLDLGCGTGFIINIAKKYFNNITGVDVTQAMLDKVDLEGPSNIKLINNDTGTLDVEDKRFDMVTAYSFLHHLYDIRPTLEVAYRGLKEGGILYTDLDPNFYFWDEIGKLDRNGIYDEIVKREIEMTTFKDEDIEKNFGVDKETFNNAEFGKNIKGGFKEELVINTLKEIGFKNMVYKYHWYLGEGALLNDSDLDLEEALHIAKYSNKTLQKSLPLTRHIFKYVSIEAEK